MIENFYRGKDPNCLSRAINVNGALWSISNSELDINFKRNYIVDFKSNTEDVGKKK